MENKVKRESMVFYDSFFESVVDLPPEEFKKSVCAILDYGLNGKMPETFGIEKTIFVLVKPQIDKNNQRWSNAKKSHDKCKSGDDAAEKKKAKESEIKSCEPECESVIDASVADFEIPLPEEPPFEENDDCNEVLAEVCYDTKTNPNDLKEACGEYNNVYLSVVERGKLIANLGINEYMKRLEFFSAYLKRKPEHKSACHYIDLSDWVGNAVAERRKNAPEINKPPIDFDFEDIYEKP